MKTQILKRIEAIESKIIQKTMKKKTMKLFINLEGENYFEIDGEIVSGDDMLPYYEDFIKYEPNSHFKVTFTDD